MLSAEDLAAELRAKAAELGVAAIGFAAASPMHEARRAIEQRKAAGLDAGMQFTFRAPERSTDPSRALPGAVSLVVVAWPYGPPHASADRPRARATDSTDRPKEDRLAPGRTAPGRLAAGPPPEDRSPEDRPPQRRPTATVALYARRDHYADLRAALNALAGVLKTYGWRARALVDDNALVDRAAAHRAGLGWFGKNCNILLPGRGSLFLLGSVVTDAPLPESGPVPDGCGSCRRCQVACPTGALVGPGTLDARRCLAWLLQAPGPFPFQYREALGGRIYGCDDCQTCCPVNLRAARGTAPAPGRSPAPGASSAPGPSPTPGPSPEPANPSGGSGEVDLLEVLSSTDAELLGRYGRWYIPRRDPRYLRRNALVALGNVADPQDGAVEAALLAYLQGADPLLRSHAVWAALRLGRHDLVDATQAAMGETPPEVRQELARREEVTVRPASSAEVAPARR